MNISNPDMLTTGPKPPRCMALECGREIHVSDPEHPQLLCPACFKFIVTGECSNDLRGRLALLNDHADLYSRGEQPSWARPVRHDMGG